MRLKEAAMAAGIMAGGGAVESGCDDKLKTVEVAAAEQAAFQSGDWRLTAKATTDISFGEATEKTFFNWISGRLNNDPVFVSLSKEDQTAFVDGFIGLTRTLNPSFQIDDFSSLKVEDAILIVPVKVFGEPRPEGIFSMSEGGYSRLQELAVADGFPINRSELQQEIFNRALAAGEKMPTSPWYYVDREGSEDSQMVLAPDVFKRLEDFGQAFSKQSFGGKSGWRITVTDIMRDPAAQAKRNEMSGSTHTTGRSFDISNGRFLNPEGKYVTYSVFGADGKPTGEQSAYAEMIENEMRPAIELMLGQYGLVPFKESSHWHIYAPKNREIDLSEELTAMVEVKPVGPSDIEKELSIWKKIKKIFGEEETEAEALPVKSDRPEIVEKLNAAFAADQERIVKERLSSAEVDARLVAMRPIIDSALRMANPNKQGFEYPILSVLTSNNLILAPVKIQLLDLIERMSPDDIERLNILNGTTVHGARIKIKDKKEPIPPFFRLREAWQWKRDKRTEVVAEEYVDAILRLDLDGLDHSINVVGWREKQLSSIDLLRRHGKEFGFRDEILNYMTPEVAAAVIHAEFFSELDGQTFVELLPVLFEPYNMVFGPAVNDAFCSGGAVQLIQETFSGILINDGEKLKRLQVVEGDAAKFIVPDLRPDHAERRKKQKFDPDSFALAMIGNPDSAIFYGTFAILDHTKSAFKILFSDSDFAANWAKSSDGDRLIFVGSLAPLAINGGGPIGDRAARELLKKDGLSLHELAKSLPDTLPDNKRCRFARRGAERGFETMSYFVKRTKDN